MARSRELTTLNVLGDGPVQDAARLMGLQPREFERLLPQYLARGFPPADPVSGLLDLDAIVEWRRRRHPAVYGLTAMQEARDARGLVAQRLAEMSGGRGKAR